MSEAATLNKLIILYIFNQVDFPITNGQITEFMADVRYMDYFTLQDCLSNLLKSELISSRKISNRTEYRITDEGRRTLSYFQDRISDPIQKEIRDFLRQNAYDLKNETSVQADYYRNTSREFSVHCRIMEGPSALIDMTVTVPTQMQAEASVIKWKKNYQKIYESVMKDLL